MNYSSGLYPERENQHLKGNIKVDMMASHIASVLCGIYIIKYYGCNAE